MIVRPLTFLMGALLLLAPIRVFAHGTEFVFAKLDPGENGLVQLELTVDYGQNPMINGEDDAEDVLRHVLRASIGGVGHDLGDLGTLRIEKRSRFDPSTPLPTEAPGEVAGHELLTAIWSCSPNAPAIAFAVPERNPHNVIFWTIDRQKPTVKPKWLMLISGEQTPLIPIPAPDRRMMKYGGGGAAALAGLVVLMLCVRRFKAAG